MVAYLAAAHAGLDEETKTKELLDELILRSKGDEKGVNIYVVHVFNAIGDSTSARLWLEKARKSNDVDLIWWNVDPILKNLREQLLHEAKQPVSADFLAAEGHIIRLLESEMPKLPYHNLKHIYDVLNSALVIAENEGISGDEIKLLRLAALFHDAGYIHSSRNHEKRAAAMAREILPAYGLSIAQVDEIRNMILATRTPQLPVTKLEKILCDADLDYLGRDDFYETERLLLEELRAHGIISTEKEWNILQRTFLESHHFHTDYGKTNRENSKKQRLREIVDQLKNQS
jgi:predicted metal-dependent HD superfamily phosphohydrolase